MLPTLKPKVIVPYARNRIALAILRSLSSVADCYVADSTSLPMARFSRYSKGFFKYPSNGSGFLTWAEKKRLEGFVIFPTFQESWLLKRHGLIDSLPTYDSIMRANNKWDVHKLCKELVIPTPTTMLLSDYVIKPLNSRGAQNVAYVSNVIAQNRIYGEAIGVAMLYNHGKPKAQFAWKRLVEYPKSGGMSVVRESIRAPAQEEHTERLLSSLNWHGVAMVEFKGSYVLEINPRFWGSLQLAIDSGVDFPKLLLNIITTGNCEEVFHWKTCIKTSWVAGCLRRGCRPQGNLEDLRRDDPLPFFVQFLLPLQNVLRGKGLVLDTT